MFTRESCRIPTCRGSRAVVVRAGDMTEYQIDNLGQAVEQYVAVFNHPVAGFQVGRKKGANAGFDQNVAALFLHQHGPAAQRDPILVIGFDPAGPEGLGGIAEHGAAIQALAVAFQRGDCAHG